MNSDPPGAGTAPPRTRGTLLRFLLTGVVLLAPWPASAGTYLNSAHGDTLHGVLRPAMAALGYSRGNCGHCHEQHASVDNAEPAPAGGAAGYMLFSANYVSQNDAFCFKCHAAGSPHNGEAIINRSYSYRAGAWTGDTVADIQSVFGVIAPGTAHNLADIQTFIAGKWRFTDKATPCAACHDPHAVQGDPENAGNGVKSSGSRGWPASRPSLHATTNSLWGDEPGERMNAYTGDYQAPYRYYAVTPSSLEPVGDALANSASAAQNTVDYNTFCLDCHDAANTIYSTPLARNLRGIDWDNSKHGKLAASNDAGTDVLPPYQDAQLGSYVLACTDCHEPHGSTNVFLVRAEVNGRTPVTVTTALGNRPGPTGSCNKEWTYLCGKCHAGMGSSDGHPHPSFVPPATSGCSSGVCHASPDSCIYTACGTCHFHGSDTISGTPYGEKLF
ncbi:MAG: cytochrome c3 family protein [Thermodesulfobacteriota bacterium]